MNSSDTLREILLRTKNPRVFPLLSSEMEELSSVILADNKFWHGRLEHYLGRDLSWNSSEKYEPTYWSLIGAANEKVPSERYKHAHTLPALLLIEEEYGPPDFNAPDRSDQSTRDFLFSITDANLLDYVLSNEDIYGDYEVPPHSNNRELITDFLDKMVLDANVPMISRLASHLGQSDYLMDRYTEQAVKANVPEDVRMDIFRALLPLADLEQASTYAVILSVLSPDLWDLYRDAFMSYKQINRVTAYLAGNIAGLKFLLSEEPEASKEIDWVSLFNSALARSSEPSAELAKLAVQHLNVNTNANPILVRAARSSSIIFEAVLSDERINPMANIQRILLAILDRRSDRLSSEEAATLREENRRAMSEPCFSFRYQDQKTGSETISNYEDVIRSLLILCRDVRFRFDELTVQEVRLLGYGLYSQVLERVSDEELVVAQLEGEVTVYSHLLRYILFANPSREGLGQFMLDEGRNDIYLAAHSVVGNYVPKNKQVNVIRALLLQMVHSNMTVGENMIALRQEGATEETLKLSRALCSALGR